MTKKSSPTRKPDVSIIGSGRLGQALALALQSCGYPVVALVAQHRQKAIRAAALLSTAKARPLALNANQLRELPETDLIIIATPDDAIEDTARNLSTIQRGGNRRTVLHTSGALSSVVLNAAAKQGFNTGSIHPLVSISEPTSGAGALRGAFYCLEGTSKAKTLAASLVRDLGGTSFTITPENKALYHAAAVMASPHLTALFDIATELLAACGLSKSKAQKVFVPLLESTVHNLKSQNAQQALTGTFARGDAATVRRHLAALSGIRFEQALEIYKLLGLHSLQLAKKNGLDRERLEQIKNLLNSASREKRR
jgi:predicted short-subunit dehydrogenase-like oxidoreductase (DUF2520 family)